MMAQSWDVFHWINEPLDGEAPYKNGEIIEADSDIDDSPSTKADRKRRRQAIGQRYLLGIVPFIQSASLQGPFDPDSGWVNPWKHVRPRQRPPPYSVLPRIENITIDLTETDDQTPEETCRYDADIEDEAGEAFLEDDYRGVRNVIDMDLPDLKGAQLPFDNGRIYFDSDDAGPAMLQPILHSMNECQLKGDSMRKAHLKQGNGKKRNANTGWLKGRSIAKRSHHVVLDHSSPTPVSGSRQKADERLKQQSCSTEGAPGKRQGHGMSQELQSANAQHVEVYDNARTSASKVLPDLGWSFEEHYQSPAAQTSMMQMRRNPEADTSLKRELSMDDFSSVPSIQEVEQDLEKSCSGTNTKQLLDEEYLTTSTSTAFGNGRSTELIYGEIYDDRYLDDIHGLDQASRLAIAGAGLDPAVETARPTKLDIRELSSSEIIVEDIRSIKMARQLSRGETLFCSANDQSADQEFLPLSIAPDIRNVGLEDIIAFSNTPSPASEQSFQYRKTNQRSKSFRTSDISSVKRSPRSDNRAEAAITNNSPKPTIHTHNQVTGSSSFENEGVTKVGMLVDIKSPKKRRKRSNVVEPKSESSGIRMENAEGSSPDPLSEGFRGSSQARITPSNNGQIMADELARNCSQNLRGNIDNETGLVQLDPSTYCIHVEGLKSQLPEPGKFEKFLDLSRSPSSPLKPKVPKVLKSSTGPKLPRSELQPSRKSSKSELFFDNTRASLHPNPQDKKPAANVWSEITRSNLRSPEDSRGAKITTRNTHIPKRAPGLRDSKTLVTSSNSEQSPWITTGVEVVGRTSSSISAPDEIVYSEAKDQTWRHEKKLPSIDDQKRTSFDGRSQLAAQKVDVDQEPNSLKSPASKRALTGAIPPFAALPSTQVLVEATTDNPWNSTLKRSLSVNSQKNVTFSSLPKSVIPGTFPKDSISVWSPPPQSVHLADSDDPFDDRPMATKTVKVDEKSPKKPANPRWIDLPAVKSRIGFLPPSPAVGAMAEAFIAADKQILRKTSGDTGKASSQLSSMNYLDVENMGHLSKVEAKRPRARSSSPLDESFTIAPNGRLTAVNVNLSGHDAEANLASVIEEMGGVFEGWDIDTELKKAKANGPENRRDVKGRGQRGYLSGVSNR